MRGQPGDRGRRLRRRSGRSIAVDGVGVGVDAASVLASMTESASPAADCGAYIAPARTMKQATSTRPSDVDRVADAAVAARLRSRVDNGDVSPSGGAPR
ncbi:hypothetical protein ACFQJD_09775 [Haloplanus sp. GCM10025708]|uniref:hypothetical protein n=1 Tax=Haloplanus sp. GCM10025708 TaxID=3252679 RepID=UPI003618F7CE